MVSVSSDLSAPKDPAIFSPALVFLSWIPVALALFWRYPVRVAILLNFLVGWGLLPSAAFIPSAVDFPYWVMASSLPANYFFTKASVTGIACILGLLLFHRRTLSRLAISLWDLPMFLWCLAPLWPLLAHPAEWHTSLRATAYQTLAWGVPYCCGRVFFSDRAAHTTLAKALAIAGLAYLPICLVEIFTGPQLYALLYGYQPFRWIGAERYLGYRPVGLLEDGNQLGIWMATSALVAAGLWQRRQVDRILGLPIAWVAAILVTATILCQSAGSIVLLLLLIPFAAFQQRHLARVAIVLLLSGVVLFAGLRLVNVVSLRTLVKQNRVANSVAGLLKESQRGSFGWRLSQDERHVKLALEHPAFGSGRWDWWRASGSPRPWGLWLLTVGMYGIFGLLVLESLLYSPVVRSVTSHRTDGVRLILAAAILLSAIDSLLNSAVILPLLLAVGGLTSRPELRGNQFSAFLDS